MLLDFGTFGPSPSAPAAFPASPPYIESLAPAQPTYLHPEPTPLTFSTPPPFFKMLLDFGALGPSPSAHVVVPPPPLLPLGEGDEGASANISWAPGDEEGLPAAPVTGKKGGRGRGLEIWCRWLEPHTFHTSHERDLEAMASHLKLPAPCNELVAAAPLPVSAVNGVGMARGDGLADAPRPVAPAPAPAPAAAVGPAVGPTVEQTATAPPCSICCCCSSCCCIRASCAITLPPPAPPPAPPPPAHQLLRLIQTQQ